MKKLRCAIYTRKSSEEGLEQSFNSLDAQREACEAYILSQRSEGWTSLPQRYDDGGFSGGTMSRPGLERLLADVAAGRVDIVVVYKVDRLTRSLADFAKIVEVFDGHGASFVSVTQAFNTTSSMGRLTLNVLLSFAQFEREVTGERIRDKIAASKAKGMWMGGYPPLGYEVENRNLIVVEDEASIVREIFERYIALGSVHRLVEEFAARNIRSKRRTSARGITRGGTPFGRGALFHLLRNRIYLGEIVHKKVSYPGQHRAIVDKALFDRVQELLKANSVERGTARRVAAPLAGLLYDASGARMSPAGARGRSGARYRYYVSAPLQRGKPAFDPNLIRRVSASIIEQLVVERLRAIADWPDAGWSDLTPFVRRVEVTTCSVILEVAPPRHSNWLANVPAADHAEATGEGILRISFPACVNPRGGKAWVVTPSSHLQPSHRRIEKPLIKALKRAHAALRERGINLIAGRLDVSEAKGLGDPYLRRIAPLAFLAPDIQRSILEGRQPFGTTLKRLTSMELPLDWAKQRSLLGYE